jgi:hypothetical protein
MLGGKGKDTYEEMSVIIWGVHKTLLEFAVWKYQYGGNVIDIKMTNYRYCKFRCLVSAWIHSNK